MAVIALSVVGASARGDLVGYAATDHGGILDILAAMGHRVVEPSDPDATHFVTMDHNRASFAAIESRIPKERRQLVVFEPRVVLPDNYRASVRARYRTTISMGAAQSVGGALVLPWPQTDWRAHPTPAGAYRPGTSALVNANKISLIAGSLYGLRRRVIRAFDRARLPLVLAGSNWSRRGFRVLVENGRALAYAIVNRQRIDLAEWSTALPLDGTVDNVGIVGDKQAVLAAAEFGIVIENSASYVSEKLFDAMFAGCVPLYVGPPLRSVGIPDDVAVQLGAGARPDDFVHAIRTLSEAEKQRVRAAGAAWLAGDEAYRTWAMPHALARLAKAIDANITTEAGSA